MSAPDTVCETSGWNWIPHIRRPGSSKATTGEEPLLAVTANPAGARSTWSAWLIQTVSRRPSPSNSRPGSTTSSSARPYSRRPEGTTSPPSSCAIHCIP